MSIRLDELQSAYRRSPSGTALKSLSEVRDSATQTAFLCHSHLDEELAKGLQVMLGESGMELYIDWQDPEMPASPNKQTADRIKLKIRVMGWFLFLATPNSTKSRWCPWEIGYADSMKVNDKILIITTTDSSGNWYGNEYLQLYPQISKAIDGRLAVFSPGQEQGVYVSGL
jgi:TIR domain